MDTVNDRLAKIELTLKDQDNALFGHWDMITTERKPGIIEKLDVLTDNVQIVIKILRFGIVPLIIISVLAASSPYAKDFFPYLTKIIAAFLPK